MSDKKIILMEVLSQEVWFYGEVGDLLPVTKIEYEPSFEDQNEILTTIYSFDGETKEGHPFGDEYVLTL